MLDTRYWMLVARYGLRVASPQGRVQDQYSVVNSQSNHALFITPAAYPAPKPLSIFTTVTPAAHELSIPNRAVTP